MYNFSAFILKCKIIFAEPEYVHTHTHICIASHAYSKANKTMTAALHYVHIARGAGAGPSRWMEVASGAEYGLVKFSIQEGNSIKSQVDRRY